MRCERSTIYHLTHYQSTNPSHGPAAPQANDEFARWSVSQLKDFLDARDVDFSDCVEKSELVKRAIDAENGVAPTKPKGGGDEVPTTPWKQEFCILSFFSFVLYSCYLSCHF